MPVHPVRSLEDLPVHENESPSMLPLPAVENEDAEVSVIVVAPAATEPFSVVSAMDFEELLDHNHGRIGLCR